MLTTNLTGSPSINPTSELLIGNGIVLTNPAAGVAELELPPPQQERILGLAESGSSGADFPLGWSHGDGDSLLDYSDPLHPTVLADGEYALTLPVAWVTDVALSATFGWRAYLDLDFGLAGEWLPAEFDGQQVVKTGAVIESSEVTLSWTGKLTAGQSLSVFVHQDHAASSQAFTIGAQGSGKYGTVSKLSAAGSGGAPAAVVAQYSGNPLTIANTATASLTWDSLDQGVELLDRSSPAAPLVLADGLYVLSVQISPVALSAGGFATLAATLTNATLGVEADTTVAAAQVAAGIAGDTATTVPLALRAGDPVAALVTNGDGALARDFALFAAFLTKLG